MPCYTLVIGRPAPEARGCYLNLIDENGRETGALCLGELLEQITVLAMAHGWPPRGRELYPMLTPQQEQRRQDERAARRERAANPNPHHST